MTAMVGDLGNEFRVNTSTQGLQFFENIDALADGGFVVTWLSQDSTIKAQRFDANGLMVGSETAVDGWGEPAVTGLASGGFVVTWAQGSLGSSVEAQVFDQSGSATTTAFSVYTPAGPDGQAEAQVFALASGGFAVTWEDNGQTYSEDGYNIRLQMFDSTGSKVGSALTVNEQILGVQNEPAGISLAGGGFVLVWTDQRAGGGDDDLSVKGQIFDSAGNPVGNNFLINTITANNQSTPDITALPNGGFVVAWQSYDGTNEAKAQIFDSAGNKVGAELLASTPGDDVERCTVTATESGGFLVAWEDYPGPNYNQPSVNAQLFDPEGNRIGFEFQINSIPGDYNSRPEMTTLASGNVAAVWTNNDSYGNPDDLGIKAQLLEIPSFGTSAADTWNGTSGNDLFATLAGNDELNGGPGADSLDGGPGNDLLDGGTGADSLYGGAGDDKYIVDDAADQIFERTDEGSDTVVSSISFTLAANVENLTLTGTANLDGFGNGLANALTGNSSANKLYGLEGDDLLNGRGGVDTMVGGTGNDVYYVDNYKDKVIENAGEGTDSVFASTNFKLSDNVEKLTMQASADLWAYGNALDNVLTGNTGANRLYGLDGNDKLSGGAGNDILDGGTGVDTLIGGTGDDLYYIGYGDIVIEQAGEGTDTVFSSGDNYTLAANVENLTLVGYAVKGSGNDLDNVLHGNDLDNLLFGYGSNDILSGGNGNDELLGGTGNDKMYGGAGDDIYEVDSAQDRAIEYAGEGNDTVYTSISYTLGQNVENLSVMAANVVGTGNALDNVMNSNNVTGVVLRGMGGNDQLIGYAYAEKLDGGDGNDWIDGSWGNDTIIGGAGDDMLIGGVGRDTLIGGAGDDTFLFTETISSTDFGGATRATADRITDFTGGQDTIDLSGVDADTVVSGDQAFAFIGTSAFSNTAGELRYEQVNGNTYVSGDTNGDGIADFIIKLDGLHTLSTSDFGL